MADVQVENGFTKIANELFAAVQCFKFTVNQYKIIMVIWRFTYGFGRTKHSFSLGFLEKATYLTRARVSENLKDLIEKGVLLEIEKGGGSRSKILSFNKNYDEWKIETYASASLGSIRNDTTTSLQNDTSGGLQNDTKERKKKGLKKKIYIDFPINGSSFLNIYNHYFKEKFHKDHMKITTENKEFILSQVQQISTQIHPEEFKEIVSYHFENLPKSNNGNILAFFHALPRYRGEESSGY